MDPKGIDRILEKYEYKDSAVIAILQDLQEEDNYLSENDLVYISENLPIPLTRVYSIATFYNAFSLTPRGKYPISVCLGTACHVRGAPMVLDRLRLELDIDVGGVTDDGLFSLETVNCLGACAMGPIVVVGKDYHGQMTPAKVGTALKKYRKPSKE
jgi:NADH-quinone oxidoreductase subunit E